MGSRDQRHNPENQSLVRHIRHRRRSR
ncbi:hypothetical protein LINPERPRIM_LOCUS19882 [Linum perenne]